MGAASEVDRLLAETEAALAERIDLERDGETCGEHYRWSAVCEKLLVEEQNMSTALEQRLTHMQVRHVQEKKRAAELTEGLAEENKRLQAENARLVLRAEHLAKSLARVQVRCDLLLGEQEKAEAVNEQLKEQVSMVREENDRLVGSLRRMEDRLDMIVARRMEDRVHQVPSADLQRDEVVRRLVEALDHLQGERIRVSEENATLSSINVLLRKWVNVQRVSPQPPLSSKQVCEQEETEDLLEGIDLENEETQGFEETHSDYGSCSGSVNGAGGAEEKAQLRMYVADPGSKISLSRKQVSEEVVEQKHFEEPFSLAESARKEEEPEFWAQMELDGWRRGFHPLATADYAYATPGTKLLDDGVPEGLEGSDFFLSFDDAVECYKERYVGCRRVDSAQKPKPKPRSTGGKENENATAPPSVQFRTPRRPLGATN